MARVKILGSAAAEGIPAIFCNCRVCQEAWKNGGKDVRMRAAYQLSDRVRVDFGPDSLAQEYRFALHSENLRHLFITHSHEDHFYPSLLNYRKPGFSVVPEDNILKIYGNPGVIRQISLHFWEKNHAAFGGDYQKYRLQLVPLQLFQAVELPDDDMTFFPLLADHFYKDTEIPNIYAFRIGKSWGLIANDTGYYPDDTWRFLEEQKFVFDLVISDCTGGILDNSRGHHSGKYMLAVKERLQSIGSVIPGKTRYVINHFSHNGQATHAELEEHFTPHGLEVAYDGMEIEF
ncbi:MAG: hypothetical protein GX902_11945 [Lentisphaerae bacterium]|nr:hypothetical protein [Lentisphaerota bacterium]